MKVTYSYYRHLRERLGDRANTLRYIIVDRIFAWADYHTSRAFARIDALEATS